MSDDASKYGIARTVLDMVRMALEDVGRPASQSHVTAGSIAWDDCCGQLVVAPERTYRSERFPDEFTGAEQCWGGFVVCNLVVLLVRCVPTLDDQGRAPPAAEQDAAARIVLEDGATVWDCLAGATLPDGWDRAGLNQVYPAEGGCVGIETRVTIGVDTEVFG
jgi:hypothetical protein